MEKLIGGKSHPRLLLADDHAIFSDALRVYLEKECDIVGVVSDGRTLIIEASRISNDEIIADVGQTLLNGLDDARRIKELAPKIKFIFLTMQDDANLAAAALELGPVAFVLKHSAGSGLLEAINEVMRGHSYLTPKLRATDWVEAKARARQFSKDMTPRQREIVQLFAEGRPMKDIAGFLHLSEKTVEFHKHHIMVAFNLKNNADLVLFALSQGLIAPDRIPLFIRPS